MKREYLIWEANKYISWTLFLISAKGNVLIVNTLIEELWDGGTDDICLNAKCVKMITEIKKKNRNIKSWQWLKKCKDKMHRPDYSMYGSGDDTPLLLFLKKYHSDDVSYNSMRISFWKKQTTKL